MPHTRYQSCIKACNDCAIACEHCAASCLGEDHVQHMVDCIRSDLDCAGICHLAVALMARGSELAAQFCALCAEACERCADICENHTEEHCQQCAVACRICADECRRMSAMQGTDAKQRSAPQPRIQ